MAQTGDAMAHTGDDTITTIAEVHDSQISTRSGRVVSNKRDSELNPKPVKKRKTTQAKTSSGNHMTIASLSLVVDNLQQQNNERVDRLDNRVDQVNEKLDRMLTIMTKSASNEVPGDSRQNDQATVPATPRQAGATAPPVQAQPPVHVHPAPPAVSVATVNAPAPVMPPPQVIIREENHDGALDNLLAKEDYRSASTQGKPISSDQAMVKPYMYIDREGMQTPKQRLEVRSTMSFNEYINCTLLLVNDDEAYNKNDLPHILRHLSAVATDALFRPWPAVRRWTQAIWDYVERGKCKWDSETFIQNERVRMSYMSAPQASNNLTHSNNARGASQESLVMVVCRDYNGPGGCRYQNNHEDKNVKHLHICSHCDTLGRKSNHSYQRCRSKNNYQQPANPANGQGGHYDNRQWAAPPPTYNPQQQYGNQYQGVVQARGPQYQATQQAKNA